jgi:hypothetical protein
LRADLGRHDRGSRQAGRGERERAADSCGLWRHASPVPVVIPATLGFEKGVWYRIRQGIRGILVPDERDAHVVYMVCEPASHYYQVMTRCDRMPLLIEERI